MLSGPSYALYTYSWGKEGESRRLYGKQLREQNKWFTFSQFNDKDSYPKNGKDFNQFTDKMIYRSVKITGSPLHLLLNVIQKDVQRMLSIVHVKTK